MKKLLLALASLFILLIGAAAVIPAMMDLSQYKAQALAQVKTMTGHEVEINGPLSVGLLPFPKAYAENIIVKAPAGAAAENLASVGRVDLHLAIAPLLTGKIAISQVSFVDPVVAIEVLADGRQSWQTAELDALMDAKEPQPNEQALDISVQNFSVKNGKFSFTDKEAGSNTAVSDINLSMGADSMQGPFKGEGGFKFNEQNIAFEAHTGRMGGTSMAVNADVSVDEALKLTYAGVMGLGEEVDLQGETALKIDNLQKFAESLGTDLKAFKAASLELKGVLNAKADTVSLKDMVLDLSGDRFTGSLEGTNADRLSLKGGLVADKPVNLDKLVDIAPASGSGKSPAKDAAFLPKTIALPAMDLAVALKAPAVIYKGEEYRNVDIDILNAPEGGSLALKVGAMPGPGSLNLEAGVKQGGTPSVAVALKADSKNLPYTLESLGIPVDPKTVENVKTANADINANIYASRIDFDNSAVEIDGSPLAFSGSYAASGPNGKPVLRLNAAAGTLDLNDFMPPSKKPAGEPIEGQPAPASDPANIKETLATLALPFDFDFDISAESLTVQDHTFKGLAASGAWVKNALSLNGFSVKDFAGAAVQAKGKVDNIQTLQGVDMTLGAQANDVQAVAKVLGLDASSLPDNLGRTDVSAALKGSADNMNVLANIKALSGEVIVQGAVADPLGAMKADKMSLQVKHRSVNEAINIFAPGSGNYASLNGPLDFYTDVQIADKVTKMN
ncbi:MAG TPA: AsmA family protein, partial [Alphaproteobacteria bacterium]|nr:AsmA family protein [Alphaproteobacteria bacterium]